MGTLLHPLDVPDIVSVFEQLLAFLEHVGVYLFPGPASVPRSVHVPVVSVGQDVLVAVAAPQQVKHGRVQVEGLEVHLLGVVSIRLGGEQRNYACNE